MSKELEYTSTHPYYAVESRISQTVNLAIWGMAEQAIDHHWYASGSMRGQVQPFNTAVAIMIVYSYPG
jgi:hypothetical protein